MKIKLKKYAEWLPIVGMLILFLVFSACVKTYDVKAIGPNGTSVGFSALNGAVRDALGFSETLYRISDLTALLALVVVFCFAMVGLCQWIIRKKMLAVDASVLVLGLYYIVVLALYFGFTVFSLNYRPVLMNGVLELSYPSSHILLSVCVFATAPWQIKRLLGNSWGATVLEIVCYVSMVLAIATRLLSGIHWFTDIFGGLILASFLVMLYQTICRHLPVTFKPYKTSDNQLSYKAVDGMGLSDETDISQPDMEESGSDTAEAPEIPSESPEQNV